MATKNDKMGQAGRGSIDTGKSTGFSADEEAKNKMASLSSCGTGCDSAKPIAEHMDVVASCGTKIGVVDRVETDAIKLTKKDSPDGQHHKIPTAWVDHVDRHVHLKKNSEEAKREWQPA